MNHTGTDVDGNDFFRLDNGETVGTGLKPADMARMAAAPQYMESFPLVSRSEWPKAPGEKAGGLRAFAPPSRSQANTSACGGYGGGAAFTAAFNFGRNEFREFSYDFLYGMVNGGRDQGSRPEELRDQLAEGGICLKSTVGPQQIYASRYPSSARTEASRFRVDQCPVFTTVDELVTAVIRRHAVFTGIWCGGNFVCDPYGRVRAWDRTRRGGHCTGQIGEVEYMEALGLGLWTLNSWYEAGKTPMWGVNGWCWIPIGYFEQGLRDFGGVAVVSVKPDPSDPTPVPDPQTAA